MKSRKTRRRQNAYHRLAKRKASNVVSWDGFAAEVFVSRSLWGKRSSVYLFGRLDDRQEFCPGVPECCLDDFVRFVRSFGCREKAPTGARNAGFAKGSANRSGRARPSIAKLNRKG